CRNARPRRRTRRGGGPGAALRARSRRADRVVTPPCRSWPSACGPGRSCPRGTAARDCATAPGWPALRGGAVARRANPRGAQREARGAPVGGVEVLAIDVDGVAEPCDASPDQTI